VIGRWRWLGAAGAVLLAVGGHLAGAMPGGAPRSQAEALWGGGAGFRIGLVAYVAGLVLLGVAWWRIGSALRCGSAPGLRWMLATGAWWAVPLLFAPPLGSRDVYAYACQGAVWLDGHDPYAVGAAVGGCPWLAEVPALWQDSTAPYGPLALLTSAVAVAVARSVTGGGPASLLVAVGALRAVAVAGALLVAAYGPRLARACGVDPAAATWLGLVTPLVAVHVVGGAHNDALVAGLVVAGLALAAPPRGGGGGVAFGGVVAAGTALGLAVAVKITAIAVLPFAAVLALAPRRRRRRWGRAVGVLAAAAGGFGGLTLLTGLGTGWIAALAGTGALAQWSSLPTAIGMAVGYGLWGAGLPEAYDPAVGVARIIGLAALVGVAAALLRRAWQHADNIRVVVMSGGIVLGAVVALGPVVYPWYAVTPLAVLAASTISAAHRRWLALATLVFTGLVLPSGLGVPVLTKLPGAILVAILVAVVSWRWWRRSRARSASAAVQCYRRLRGPRAPAP
jgi:hypothetical protein